MRKILLFLGIFSMSYLFATDFVENKHYYRMPHVEPQNVTEIHYFFSFYCPSCARMAEMMDAYLYEQNSCLVYRHPLVNNKSGVALLKAYNILVRNQQGHCYKKLLYGFSPHQKVGDKDILTLFHKNGHPHFEQWWEQTSVETLDKQMKADAECVKAFRLKAIPTVVIVGPKGAYYIQPSKVVTLDTFTQCLDHVIMLQNAR